MSNQPVSSPATDFAEAINVRLALLGQPMTSGGNDAIQTTIAPIIARQRELNRRLDDQYCGADQRIQDFITRYLEGCSVIPQLPRRTFVLDQPGLARTLSLPKNADDYSSALLSSYRLANG
ncbi:MAG: hypothetical protein ACRCWS_05705, partial [Propionibacteriaceae bacterium]